MLLSTFLRLGLVLAFFVSEVQPSGLIFSSTMAKPTKRRRASQSNVAKARQATVRKNYWRDVIEDFDERSASIANHYGRTCTVHENKLVLLALKMVVKLQFQMVECKAIPLKELTWTKIDKLVAKELHKSAQTVREIRQTFIDENEVLLYGEEFGDGSIRGAGAANYSTTNTNKLTGEHLAELIKYVDGEHAEGRTVTNRICRNHIRDQFGIQLAKSMMSRYFCRLGLSWQPVKSKKRRVGEYRMDAIRDYLIGLDKLVKEKALDPDSKIIFVFTDESFIHQNHSSRFSFLGQDKGINKSSGKGRRLIILHAITEDGPLCEYIDLMPVDDLKWNGDTPHPTPREDGKRTAECLWLAQSSSGDYHDNMTSDNFMRWVEEKLVPTFERLYPDQRMVLIADNAPYHHKRVIGSLAKQTKGQMVDLLMEHKVEYLDLPWTDKRFQATEETEDNRGAYCRIKFDETAWRARASPSKPFTPTVAEMKEAAVRYFQERLPELLECKVEQFMKGRGHSILWTPPYCPELQPIELFWAAGKNHAAELAFSKRAR